MSIYVYGVQKDNIIPKNTGILIKIGEGCCVENEFKAPEVILTNFNNTLENLNLQK